MASPLHPLPVVERWDCYSCGICCRGALVELSDRDIKQLSEQNWQMEDEFRNIRIVVRDRQIGGYRLAHRDDENCVFLTADGLCRIHQRFGFDAKPERCKIFPLQVVSLGDVAYITTRRACPSAAADRGRPVAEHAAAVQYFRQTLVDQHRAPPPAITPGNTQDWSSVRSAGRSIERLVCDGRTFLAERLCRALAFCDHLESSLSTSPVPTRSAYKLLLKQCEDKAARGPLPDEPPGNVATSLMRQVVVDFLLLHPKRRTNRSWFGNLQRAWHLLRIARGQGRLPDLGCGFPIATFADLEQPVAGLDATWKRRIDRYFETMAMSMQYLMMTRADWSVTESFRALALTYPVCMWLLRWQCLGRQPREADVFDLITVAERSNTTPRLAGFRHRRLVHTLAHSDRLGALARWYGQ